MSAGGNPWFAVSRPGSNALRCCACGNEIDLRFPSLDHHPSQCPACGVESLFVTWKDLMTQVVPGAAPPELARAIRWAQENLDELEFVSLLEDLTQVFDAIQAAMASVQLK